MSWRVWRPPGIMLILGVLALGCPPGWIPGVPGVSRLPSFAACPGMLVPTNEIAGAFLLHQDIRLRSDRLDVGMRLVTQKKGSRLVLVGFNTLGIKVFSIVQDGTATTIDTPLGPAWAVPPLNVLRDVHRSRFLRVPGGPFPDGDVHTTRAGLTITEHWQDGALVTRALERPDDDTGHGVHVTFAGDTVTIAHGACGYEATIVTTEERSLTEAADDDVSRRDSGSAFRSP